MSAAESLTGEDPIIHGLGLVSLIAMAPILTVMTLGLLIRSKERRKE